MAGGGLASEGVPGTWFQAGLCVSVDRKVNLSIVTIAGQDSLAMTSPRSWPCGDPSRCP